MSGSKIADFAEQKIYIGENPCPEPISGGVHETLAALAFCGIVSLNTHAGLGLRLCGGYFKR